MTEAQQATLDAIKLAAGLEAQRIAIQTVDRAVAGKLLPAGNYAVQINIEVDRKIVIAPASESVRPS